MRTVFKKIVFGLIVLFGVLPSSLIASEHIYTLAEYALPDTFDPIKMNNVPSLLVSNLIYDGLVRFSPELNIEEDIAKSWSVSTDGKTIIFKLNPDAKFQNGERIEPSDVIFSFNRLMSSKSIVKGLYECIDSIEANAKDTVTLKLKWAYPPIFGILASSTAKILPHKYATKKDFFENPIGSGPFKVSKLNKKDNLLSLVKSENYFLTRPKLDALKIMAVKDEEEAKKLAMSGEVDDLSRWPILISDPIFKIGNRASGPLLETWIIGLVSIKKPFDDIEIRKSFRASFDSEKFRKKFYPNANQSFGYIPLGISGSKTSNITQDKITKISKMPIHLAFPEQLSRSMEIKKFIENEFNSKGWNVVVDLMSWDDLIRGYSSKKYQSFFLSMNMDYPDADFLLKNFDSKNSDNFSGIKNSKLDKLLSEMRTIGDKEKRNKKYNDVIDVIDNMALTINLFHPRNNYWTSSCVKGMESNLLSSVYVDYRKVYFENGCKK